MNISKRYYVGSGDGRSIDFRSEEEQFRGFDFKINFRYVGAIIMLLVLLLNVNKYISSLDTSEVLGAEDAASITISNESLDANGFVFGNSSERVLTEEEVLLLLENEEPGFQRLIRMAINEIYARHGHVFKADGINAAYYQKYAWYNELEKHLVKWEEFNEIEKTNLRLLISIEEEYGYR